VDEHSSLLAEACIHVRVHTQLELAPPMLFFQIVLRMLSSFISPSTRESRHQQKVFTLMAYMREGALEEINVVKAWPVGNLASIKKKQSRAEEEYVIGSQAYKLCSSSVRSPFYDYPDCCGPLGHPSQT